MKKKKQKPASVLATRLEDLHQIGLSLDETTTALAAYESLDDGGKALVDGWLSDLSHALAVYDKIYALRTPDQWQRYAMMGIRNLREQVLLEEAKRAVRKLWKARPGPIR